MREVAFNKEEFEKIIDSTDPKNIGKTIKDLNALYNSASSEINEILFLQLEKNKALGIAPENNVARTLLIEFNSRLIDFVLNKYLPYTSTFDYDDLASCGLIGLVNSIDKFNPNYGTKFSTFACEYIKTAIRNEIRCTDKALWGAVSLDGPLLNDETYTQITLQDTLIDENEDFYIAKEGVEDLRRKLSEHFKYLSPREQIVIVARLASVTESQIANYLNLSRTSIDKITNDVKKKLRLLNSDINQLNFREMAILKRIRATTYPVISKEEYMTKLQAIKLGKSIQTDEANTSLTTGRYCALPDKETIEKYLSCVQYFNTNEQLVLSLYFGINRKSNLKAEDIAKILKIEKNDLYYIIQRCKRKLNILCTPTHLLTKSKRANYDRLTENCYDVLTPEQVDALIGEITDGKPFLFNFERVDTYKEQLEKIGGVNAIMNSLMHLSPIEQIIVQCAFRINGIEYMQQRQLAKLVGYKQGTISVKLKKICESIRLLNADPTQLTEAELNTIDKLNKTTYHVLTKDELVALINELKIKNGHDVTQQENLQ